MKLLAGLLYFGAALLMVSLAAWLFLRAGKRSREERLTLRLRALGVDETVGAYALRERELGNPILRAVCHALWRSGVDAEPQVVARALVIAMFLVPLALLLLGPIAGPIALAVVVALIYGWLGQQAARRRALIVSQLPDFLESVIRVLSAGNTVEESFASSARESAEPARSLFLSIGRQVRLGAQIEVVLVEAAEIHHLRDLKVIALAASINRKYGGSLRNVLKSLISAIRARDVANRELRALTAETRISAYTLAFIPVTLSLYILQQNPAYYTDIWDTFSGRASLISSILLQVAGIVVMWRMLRWTEDAAT
jgi:tight adherence protein B